MIDRRQFLRAGLATGLSLASGLNLALAEEAKFDLPIVDSHVHFWDPARLEYAWLKNSPIGTPKLPADYFRETAGCDVQKAVFVQADCSRAQSQREVEWVASLAAAERRIGAIIANAPIDEPAKVERALDDLAKQPLVKGVRRIVQGEADAQFCSRPEFVEGVRRLAARKYIFEICASAEQLPSAAALVEKCPEIRFVLDHLGNPNISEKEMLPWADDLRKIAHFPNVVCKVSGAITRANWKNWKTADLRPCINHAVECFGFERVMFGGDWPVCTLSGPWRSWLDALAQITREQTLVDRKKLFAENARKFYGL